MPKQSTTAKPVQTVEVELPSWHNWLQAKWNLDGEPVRNRVLYGGRGGGKTRTVGTEILMRASRQTERVLCLREYQTSIRDSVKRLLDDEIARQGTGVLGSGFWMSTDKEIRGANGSLFVFMGLHRNEQTIRSQEGFTLAWVEEAASVSQASIDALRPTIRQEGSEIWWVYNPRFDTDPVDQLFRSKDYPPPPGTVLIPVNWEDNLWFPEVLYNEMEYDRGRDPDKYAHVWLGQYLQRSDAKVFRNWKVRSFQTPTNAIIRFGADWGFSIDPTVLVRAFIGRWEDGEAIADPEGRCLFVDGEAYGVRVEIDDIPALFAGNDPKHVKGTPRWENPNKWPGVPGADRWRIVADSARPETISYLQRQGFDIEAALKGPGSLEDGVEFLRSYDIVVHPSCIHVIDELTHYSYKVDKKTNEIHPVLADEDNHTIDALRYALEAVRKAGHGIVHFASGNPRVMGQETGADKERAIMNRRINGQGAGWGSGGSARKGIF